MNKLNIVIIGQCIYPRLSPRAHRTWQLALNLAKKGHSVTLYALLGDTNYTEYENRYGIKIRNIGKSRLGCMDSDGKSTNNYLLRKLSNHFGNSHQIPSIELKWLVKKLIDNIGDDVDMLITIAIPHTIHWGAAEALPKKNIKYWIADCGDPFMGNRFCPPPAKYEKEERRWCEKVDAITIPIEDGRMAYYKEYRENIYIIPQGFDFSEATLAEYKPNNIPTFAFSGAVYPKMRDPKNFMQYLSKLTHGFKFVVYTRSCALFEPYASQLGERIEFREYVPRNELIHELSKMDFLINIENEVRDQLPSKLIDYGQTKRPILSITSGFTQEEQENFNRFFKGDYSSSLVIDNMKNYDINTICDKFIELYNKRN